MRFLEYITLPSDVDYPAGDSGGGPVAWLSYARCHRERLFPEITKARYFRLCNEEGEFSGDDVLLLEYTSLRGYLDCKKRTGVDTLKKNNHVFSRGGYFHGITGLKSRGVEYLEPQRESLWFDYTSEKLAEEGKRGAVKTRYLEYEYWRLADGVDEDAYKNIIDVWFKYVVEHKQRLFDEWVSARYYRKMDEAGVPTGGYAMIFEYASHEDFQAYKKRRRRSYDTNTGDYLVYRDKDPYQFFDVSTVYTHGLWPQQIGLWFG